MAANRQRQQRLLGILFVLLALVVGYELWSRPAVPAAAASTSGQRASRPRAAHAARSDTVPNVGLNALKDSRPEPLAGGRNLFQFGAAPAAVRPAGGRPGAGSPRSATAGAVAPPRPPMAPAIPLKFIGIVEAPGPLGRLAVLSDGRDVYHGHEGDIIEGRYRIVRIGIESIEMAHLDGSGRQMIRLTGGS
ncbi:MAG TPA: hypothetical protein VIC33_04355 [Vicinamibacterales bacterium]|jgi:hypothetical protein